MSTFTRIGQFVLVTGALLALATYGWFRFDMARATARIAADGRRVDTPCGPIEYGEAGSGTAVLVLHGAGGGYDQGLAIGKVLLGDGYRVIAPSRFGYLGAAIPADSSLPAQADVYACLLDTLGIERIVVLGFSAGGPSAIQFAARYPQRTEALILASAVSFTEPLADQGRQNLEGGINRVIGSNFAYWAATRIASGYLLTLLGVPIEVQQTFNARDAAVAADVLTLMHPMNRRFPGILLDQRRELPRGWFDSSVDVPTLVVHAADDTLVPVAHGKHSVAEIPQADSVLLERGGHFLFGYHDGLHRQVAAWLAASVASP